MQQEAVVQSVRLLPVYSGQLVQFSDVIPSTMAKESKMTPTANGKAREKEQTIKELVKN